MQFNLVIAASIHWLHLLAAIVWIGGLGYHLLVMRPSLGDLDPAAARRLSGVSAMRLRSVSLLGLLTALVTGLYLAAGIVRGAGDGAGFFGSPYGRVLGLKIALGFCAVFVGGFSGLVLAPRLVSALEERDERRIGSAGRRIELAGVVVAALGILATVCVGLLRVYA